MQENGAGSAADVEASRAEPEAEPPASPPVLEPQPVLGLTELVLFFYPEEIGQLEEDAALLVRKGVLRVPVGVGSATRIGEFIRFAALRHTHRAVQQMLSSDLRVVDEVKKALVEVESLRGELRGRLETVKQREDALTAKMSATEAAMVKYVALLKAQGVLESEGESS